MTTLTAPAAPATAKQIAYIESLMKTRHMGKSYVGTQLATYGIDSLEDCTKHAASNIIGVLVNEPVVAIEKIKTTLPVVEDGLYVDKDGEIWKVQKSKNSDRRYALVLVVKGGHDGFKPKGTFSYIAGAIKNASTWTRLTLEEAAQYGKRTGVCCNCGRTLTNESSISAGIGPICAQGF